MLQVAQQGLTWQSLGQSITPEYPFSAQRVFLVVAADIVLYAVLTAYLDQVLLPLRFQLELFVSSVDDHHSKSGPVAVPTGNMNGRYIRQDRQQLQVARTHLAATTQGATQIQSWTSVENFAWHGMNDS